MVPRRTVLASLLAAPAFAEAPGRLGFTSTRLARIGAFLEGFRKRGELAGWVAVAARHGQTAYLDAQGFASLESKTPMRADSLCRIASMTKPITSIAVLMLHEEMRFLLDDPVPAYLPEFRNPKVAVPSQGSPGGIRLVPASREITIHDLLTHQSGLATGSGPTGELYRHMRSTLPAEYTLAEFVPKLAALPLNFEPGTAWEYGLSTDVCGRLVEVLSGRTLEQFFEERIFEPLGMKDSHFVVPEAKLSRLATVYRAGATKGLEPLPLPSPKPRYLSGGGGLVSTAQDYLRFCQMLLNGGQLGDARLVSRKTIELMTANHLGNRSIPIGFLRGNTFGLGVAVRNSLGEAGLLGSLGAYGWSGAYNTYFRIDPKEDLILILFVQLFPANNITLQHGFHNAVMQSLAD
jgi:CubicO group peptidase (beta-lactamase class C family)